MCLIEKGDEEERGIFCFNMNQWSGRDPCYKDTGNNQNARFLPKEMHCQLTLLFVYV
jgi:hypothetical protein